MDEIKVFKMVEKLKKTGNKKEFLFSFEKWLTSMVNELREQKKTDEEIGKIISEQCYNIGMTVVTATSDQDSYQEDKLRDLLSSALLEFFVGLKVQLN